MAQVLRRAGQVTHPDLIVGTETFDDAGVFRLRPDLAIVQTVDFFPPLVDDPYTFGQIAAANSLSDIYAMGGKPITALAVVGFPDKDLPPEILEQILAGGRERVETAGAIVIGGHSVRDAEVKYGLCVTGLIHPEKVITNAGANAGDVLVLTKPLGSGTLTSAAKSGALDQDKLAECINVMTALNDTAAAAMMAVGAHAATDVTGFGLLGHAAEMARASQVCIELTASAVPLMTHARQLAESGILTRAYKATIAQLGSELDPGSVDQTTIALLSDAQTSGGLLIAVPQDKTKDLVNRLSAANTDAAVIGTCIEKSDALIRLR
jgi:selenide,water dikinase